jgi:Lrp/AsnC family transcriptional regulator, regulator of ectoine-degradation genes
MLKISAIDNRKATEAWSATTKNKWIAAMPPPIKLDVTDLRILAAIQREGRITKLALAERVGLSPTPCWTRLKRLEEAGIIAGYHARLALRLIAPIALVFMEVTLGAHRQADFDRFERAVKDIPEIVACWSVGGGVDYLVKVVARDIDAYQRLVDDLLGRDIGIDRYFTYIVTKVVKDEPVTPLDSLVSAPETV